MNTIDELIDKIHSDPLWLKDRPKELNEVIAYIRKARGLADLGVKPKKLSEDEKKGDASHILAALIPKKDEPPKPAMRRRI